MPVDFRFVDLFAGLGGFHVALSRLGGEAVFAAEWDPGLQDLYQKNFGLTPWGDITTLKNIPVEVPDHDVLTAGFPCQPFSKAGEQLGFEHTLQGRLFFKVLDVVKAKKPRRIILENVPNILRHRGGATLARITEELTALGYAVDTHRLSPHHFGIPQVRDRAYFVASLDGLQGFSWPERHPAPTDIKSVLRPVVEAPRKLTDRTLHAIDMWGDFLKRSPDDVKLPWFPVWAMEFGATYPFEDATPPALWREHGAAGLQAYRGDFGITLRGLSQEEQEQRIPSHSRRSGDFAFPVWKQRYIRQNRDYYARNRSWIDPWLEYWQPWQLPSSFQKFEWNVQGGIRDIDHYVMQVRASGIRVKRTSTAPSLIAMTHTQVPILGREVAGSRRYMTPQECAELQSLGHITLPPFDLHAYKALGNAVNARVVEEIAIPLIASLNTRPFEPSVHRGAHQAA